MLQQFCKIQSFLLEQRVRDWKGFLRNHHKNATLSPLPERWSWRAGPEGWSPPLREPALSLPQGVNNTEEVGAHSSATINCFHGHFIFI